MKLETALYYLDNQMCGEDDVIKRAYRVIRALVVKEAGRTVLPKRAVQQRKRVIADMYPDHPHINDGV